jgi:hypothetical protein
MDSTDGPEWALSQALAVALICAGYVFSAICSFSCSIRWASTRFDGSPRIRWRTAPRMRSMRPLAGRLPRARQSEPR